jgi:hypothetical protein
VAGGVSPPTGVVPGAGWSFGLGAGGFVAEGLAVEVSAVTEVVPGSDCAVGVFDGGLLDGVDCVQAAIANTNPASAAAW